MYDVIMSHKTSKRIVFRKYSERFTSGHHNLTRLKTIPDHPPVPWSPNTLASSLMKWRRLFLLVRYSQSLTQFIPWAKARNTRTDVRTDFSILGTVNGRQTEQRMTGIHNNNRRDPERENIARRKPRWRDKTAIF